MDTIIFSWRHINWSVFADKQLVIIVTLIIIINCNIFLIREMHLTSSYINIKSLLWDLRWKQFDWNSWFHDPHRYRAPTLCNCFILFKLLILIIYKFIPVCSLQESPHLEDDQRIFSKWYLDAKFGWKEKFPHSI